MNTISGGAHVKLVLDPEMQRAVDAARVNNRVTRTGFVRAAVLQALRDAGYLATQRAGQ